MYHTEKQNDSTFYFKKLTTHLKVCLLFISLFAFFSIQAKAMAQNEKIDLKLHNTTVIEAVKAVEKQTSYKFVYNNADIDVSRRVSVNVANENIEAVARAIFAGYDIAVKGKNVIVTPRKTSDSNVNTQQQQKTITVSGTVVDATGEPVIGGSVMVKGTASHGTVTDIDGNYSIANVPQKATLVFSYVGMKDQEVAVNGRTTLNVTMQEDSELLDEVVITAFGAGQKKATMVGAIQTVRPSDLKVPSANLSTSFAGRMAGVVAFQRSGQPGADGADFYIRGISTLSGVKTPLIILDGVEISKTDLDAIDTDVIDGFSILKDATATALYGSRGANGVMIITTKSGRGLDKPIIGFRMEANMAQPTYMPKFADGPTFMRLANEAETNLSGSGTRYSLDQIAGVEQGLNPYIFPNVNWYDEMFNKQAYNQKFNFNIRGGSKKLDYFMNVTINHETGMLKGRSKEFFTFDNNLQIMRYAFNNNINVNVSETAKVSLKLNAQLMDKRGPNFDDVNAIFGQAIQANPVDFPIMYEPDPNTPYVRWGGRKIGAINAWNPIGSLVSGYRDTFESTFIANLEYEQNLDFLTRGLKFTAQAAFKNWSQTAAYRGAPTNVFELSSYKKQPDGTYNYNIDLTRTEQTVVLSTTSGSTGDRTLTLKGMLAYDRTFNDAHSLNLLGVYQQEEYNRNNLEIGIGDDGAMHSFNRLVNSLPKRLQSLAGRISYAYDNRYLLELNAGYNGSENFAKGKRFGFFPSVALGYNIAEEAYFEPLKNVVQQLKLRGSWGLVGNDQIGSARFIYLPQISLSGRSYTTGIDMNESLSGPTYSRYANYNLTWEVGEKLNAGIDLKLFNDFSIVFDVFREHRRNIFQERGTIPTYLGTGSTKIYGNTGEVLNRGFDFSIDYAKQFHKDLSVFVKGTFTYAKNKILKYDEPLDQDYPNLMRIGTSTDTHIGYVAEGLFIDRAEIANRPEQKISGNVAPGDIKYKNFPDKNGEYDNQIDDNDRMALGFPTVPQIVYGIGPSIVYKNWDFGFFLQGVARTSLMMSGFHPFGENFNANVADWIVNSHWSPTNQNIHAAYPRLTQGGHGNNTAGSSFWLRDASFLKLKNMELGYKFKKMRIYISATNLLTFSNFKLWDPEMGGGSGLKYPTQRVVNLGLNVTL